MPSPSGRSGPTPVPGHATSPFAQTPIDQEMLAKVSELLASGQAAAALEWIRRSKLATPWARNAIGVCQLRLGNPKPAIELYRSLTMEPGSVLVRQDVPLIFQVNFATALFLDRNLTGGFNLLTQCKAESHPAVVRLTAALDEWKRNLTWWQRLNWKLGVDPGCPLQFSFPPGDLE